MTSDNHAQGKQGSKVSNIPGQYLQGVLQFSIPCKNKENETNGVLEALKAMVTSLDFKRQAPAQSLVFE